MNRYEILEKLATEQGESEIMNEISKGKLSEN